MPTSKATAELTRRRRSRHRGVSYRQRADGSRRYSVYFQGRYWPVEGGEAEAIAKQASFRGTAARGERIASPTAISFAELAEQWFESKRHLRPWTRKAYRAALDRELIPRFGPLKLSNIQPDQIAALIRELEARNLASSTIENYLLPLSGTLAYAVRRRLIPVNPCTLLTSDDRPQRRERHQDHIWSDQEIEALIDSAQYLARQPTSRYDYTPLIRTALYTGLRLGELLGLRWQDINLQEGTIQVRYQHTRLGQYTPPKTKAATRRIPLSDEMSKHLATLKLQSRHSDDDQPVFAARNGTPLGHRNATRRGFDTAAQHAQLHGVSFHSMRHAFASRMIDRGINSTILATLMGHESSTITERRYIHLFNQQRTDDTIRTAMSTQIN